MVRDRQMQRRLAFAVLQVKGCTAVDELPCLLMLALLLYALLAICTHYDDTCACCEPSC
jgi:hypothetical protein